MRNMRFLPLDAYKLSNICYNHYQTMKSLQLAKPHLLIIVGIPGSGKTAFAEYFTSVFRAPFFDPSSIARACEATAMPDDVSDALLEQFLRSGVTCVYEAAAGTRVERKRISQLARKHGYDVLQIWVQTDPAAAKMRATRRKRGETAAAYDEETFDAKLKKFTPPRAHEPHIVISGMHTPASQSKAVLRRLVQSSGRAPQPINTPARPNTAQSPAPARRLVQ
ncbi:hypothetical protein CR983_04265 [Candidatus Saccharibacteria bacterium]|nr:MAG: hypothetical protein CR983_04265 [Candidatus Saccharibacteria bacterium]